MFTTCDITGFKVDKRVLPLIKVNAVAAVVSLLVAIVAALLLVLTRWQAVHLLPPDWYYRILTLHGFTALIAWIIFFEMAGLYFGSTVVLNARQVAPPVGWLAFILMVAGSLLVVYTILAGKADVLFTSYAPLQAHPLYYLGIILFAVGALLVVILFFANILVAKKEKTYGEGPLPLFTFGLLTAAILAVQTLGAGALIYIPTLLWSLGLMGMDPQIYRIVWWGLGHPSQQINLTATIAIWYLLAYLTVGGRTINEKVSRFAFLFYLIGINVAAAHHLLVDPIPSSAWKVINTSYVMYIAVLASMIHAFAVPSAIEYAQRRRGFTKGLFDWLKNAPWSNPAFSGLFLSMVIFGFIGGVTGIINGMEQTNMLVHNTLTIPAHFKGTVVGGTTLTFMAVTYYLIPLVFRKKIMFFGLAKLQPWVFGLGIATLAAAMGVLGYLGVPRRVWDSTYAEGPFTYTYPAIADLFWVVFALGGVVAFIGALMWVLIVVASVFFGSPVRSKEDMFAQMPISPEPPKKEGVHIGYVAPGTFALTLLFMITFLIFAVINWGWLSILWEVR